MPDTGLQITRRGNLLILAIDRPQVRNALNPATLQAITDALSRADADPNLRAVILRGVGELGFSSGYDLGKVADDTRYDVEAARALHAPIRGTALAMGACRHVVVVAIRDFAMGAALDIAAHGDLRVASDPSRFLLPTGKLGFSYPIEALRRLRWTLGASATEALLLEARQFSGAEMLGLGFLHHLWPAAEFEASLEELLARLEERAPLALRALKRSLRHLSDDTAHYDAEAQAYDGIVACLNSEDAREGPAAFRERRPARFTGR